MIGSSRVMDRSGNTEMKLSQMFGNKTGFLVGAFYTAIALPLLIAGHLIEDGKGSFVLKQLAVMPAILVADGLQLGPYLAGALWLNNFPALFVLNLLLAYALGLLIHSLFAAFKRSISTHRR